MRHSKDPLYFYSSELLHRCKDIVPSLGYTTPCSLELGPHFTGAEARKVRVFIRSYRGCYVFSLQDLEGYKGTPIHIQVKDDHLILWRFYRLSISERIGVQALC